MNLQQTIRKYESYALEIAAAIAPWIAPVMSAYLVGMAVVNQLEWHRSIGIVAAIAVEAVGIVSVANAIRLQQWNSQKRKSDPAAPFLLSLASVIMYFIATIMLTVFLETLPELQHYAPAIFPVLTAVGAINIAIRNAQNERETAVTSAKAESNMTAREASVRRKLKAVNDRTAAVKRRETIVNGSEADVTDRKQAVMEREADADSREADMAERERALVEREQAARLYELAAGKMNETAVAVMLMLGGSGKTQAEIAAACNVSAGYVSGVKKKMEK